MATKTFHIELRATNVDTPERMDALREALKAAGRTLHAKATLICEGVEPEIVLYGEDFASGMDEITIGKEEGTDAEAGL